MRAIAAAVAAVILLAGCLVPANGPPPQPSAPTESAGGLIDTRGTPPSLGPAEDWSKLEFHASGPPGSWAFIYRELPEPSGRLEYEIEFQARAESVAGDAPVVLFGMPPTVVKQGNESLFLTPELAGVRVGVDGKAAELNVKHEIQRILLNFGDEDAAPFIGFAAAIGSTGSWEASITIDLRMSGNVTGPSFLSMNEGFIGEYSQESPLGESFPLIGGQHAQFAISESGWSHVELHWDPLLSHTAYAALQLCTIRWNSTHETDCSSRVATAEVFGERFPPRLRASWGRAGYGPGEIKLEVTYFNPVRGMAVSISHLPTNEETFPDKLKMSVYLGNKDVYSGQPTPWVASMGHYPLSPDKPIDPFLSLGTDTNKLRVDTPDC